MAFFSEEISVVSVIKSEFVFSEGLAEAGFEPVGVPEDSFE